MDRVNKRRKFDSKKDKDADLSVKIKQGFGPDGLGILSICDVPGYASLRQNLLNLAPRLVSLPEEVLKELDDPRSRYNFGWSHGKEKLESGKPGEICSGIISAESGIKIPCPDTATGHPNVDALINTYLANEKDVDLDVDVGQSALLTNEFNQHYTEVQRELELEKKRKDMIPEKTTGSEFWFDEPIDGMDVAELEQYLSSLQELKRKVLTRADELLMMNNAPALFGSAGTECAAASAGTGTECYVGSAGTECSESTGLVVVEQLAFSFPWLSSMLWNGLSSMQPKFLRAIIGLLNQVCVVSDAYAFPVLPEAPLSFQEAWRVLEKKIGVDEVPGEKLGVDEAPGELIS
ncbi:hypothetical protein Tco_1376990 [Tanacetum coccineum]